MNKPLSLIVGILALANVCAAQTPATTPVTEPQPKVDNSLAGQYNTVYKMAEHWQQAPIIAYHKSVTDTLNAQRRRLSDANAKLAEQAKTITELQGSAGTKEQSLTELQKKVNSISLLGIPMTKSAYNILMWGLVLVLGGGLATVIYMSASARTEAAFRINEHETLSAEFAAYKVKAGDKEKKLARELQTERNKVEELTGR